MSKVVIIGAGLAGSLLAIYLAKRGIAVDVYEARGDMRLEEVAAGRSINLALSDRGIAALREVGMDEYMLAEAVPMYGRMIHSEAGGTRLLPIVGMLERTKKIRRRRQGLPRRDDDGDRAQQGCEHERYRGTTARHSRVLHPGRQRHGIVLSPSVL